MRIDPEIRLTLDDFIPRMRDMEVASQLVEWAKANTPPEALLIAFDTWASMNNVTWTEIKWLIADLIAAGVLPQVAVSGENLPNGRVRPSAPTGIGINGTSVWATPPEGSYVFRFYVNGELKLVQPDYYITTLETIGAMPGDIVQICKVSEGLVGWWSRIAVPT